MWRSQRPGRNRAGSSASGWLLVYMKIISDTQADLRQRLSVLGRT